METNISTQDALNYLLTTYGCGRDIMSNNDRILLQTTHNTIFPDKFEVNRNCGACRVRMFNRLKSI